MRFGRRGFLTITLLFFAGVSLWLLDSETAQTVSPPSASMPAAATESPEDSVPAPKTSLPAKSAAPKRSVAASSPMEGWSSLRDPFTGKIRTYTGGKLDLSGADEREKAEAFVKAHSGELFGVSSGDLAFAKASKAARTKVIYQQMMAGYPIFGSTLALLFEDGQLQRVQNDLQSEPQLPQKPDVRFEEIFESYRQRPGGGLRAQGVAEKVELVKDPALFPRLILYPAQQGLIFVYQFYVDESPQGRAPARAMILYDPAGSRVVQKTNMHLE